jgi:hypothetical protein
MPPAFFWRKAGAGGESVLDRVLRGPVQSGRDPRTTTVTGDSKSVKNTDTSGEKGFDAGKKLPV